jgi:hypothetical protein
MPNLFDPHLTQTYQKDKKYLEQTELPIITVSASYREDLKRMHGLPDDDFTRDIVFSRAHYSMALAVAATVWQDKINPKKAWVVDPTNYVSQKQWRSITLTETIGKTIARYPLLKTLKDIVDKFGRGKLPILSSITPPLLYLTENVTKPVLSFHIAAGNILAEQGKTVVQMITDPHVREEYITNAGRKNMSFCVFDEHTKTEFLEKAKMLDIKADANKITVTGPPVDPRVIAAATKKKPWKPGQTLKLCITTGGLGTNKQELLSVLEQLLPELRRQNSQYQVLVYASTHLDIADDVKELALAEKVKIGKTNDKTARLRLIYHPQIVDANEQLIKYGFPWAHGFITKPSGDMAYDAAVSGSFILTLSEWGEWELRIREIFEQRGIARKCLLDNVLDQLQVLMAKNDGKDSWITNAQLQTAKLEKVFTKGAKNILAAVEKSTEKSS